MMSKKSKYQVSFLYRPGLTMSDEEIAALQQELRGVAATCFDEIPEYQCLLPGRASLEDKVITVARRSDGRMAGFCSAVLLPVEGVGEVFHMGLTCVHQFARGHRLTHKLTSRLLAQYMLRYRPFGRLWISNAACVLSSLGNIALNFEDVFPSPYGAKAPSETHMKIAGAISAHYRAHMAVRDDAVFCPHSFVFQGSVEGTSFQKTADDTRYHHRKPYLNQFYMTLLNFEGGDEVLQVGYVSLATLAKYFLTRGKRVPLTAADEILAARS